eukprot:1117131-Pleurochrysis_carterae.AAC.1
MTVSAAQCADDRTMTRLQSKAAIIKLMVHTKYNQLWPAAVNHYLMHNANGKCSSAKALKLRRYQNLHAMDASGKVGWDGAKYVKAKTWQS